MSLVGWKSVFAKPTPVADLLSTSDLISLTLGVCVLDLRLSILSVAPDLVSLRDLQPSGVFLLLLAFRGLPIQASQGSACLL